MQKGAKLQKKTRLFTSYICMICETASDFSIFQINEREKTQ